MDIQTLKRDKERSDPSWLGVGYHRYPVANTCSGTEGTRLVNCTTSAPGPTGSATWNVTASNRNMYVYNTGQLPTVSMMLVTRTVIGPNPGVGADEYNPAFVAEILAADAAPAEEGFDNVVDLLDWLNRD